MKKVILSLVAVVAFTFASNAQTDIDFGVKGGLNIASLSGDDTDGFESIVGFNFGALAEFDINDKFAVQPEVLFSREGGKVENADEDDASISYLQIPIMAKYQVAEGLDVLAGPRIGFQIAEGDAYEDPDFESIEFGLGAGLEYEFGESGFIGTTRYNFGLTDLADGSDVKQNNFAVGVAYEF